MHSILNVLMITVIAVIGVSSLSADYVKQPSRATTFDRKISLTKQHREKDIHELRQRTARERPVDHDEREEERLAKRREEFENDESLTEEEREMHRREHQREIDQREKKKKQKKNDPYLELRQRTTYIGLDHDAEVEVPSVTHPEPVVDLAIYNGTDLDGFFTEVMNHVIILLVSEECESCAHAEATFRAVAKRFAEADYHLPRDQRNFRFAVFNVSENPDRFFKLQELLINEAPHMYHMPSTLVVTEAGHLASDTTPHHINYNERKYESDLEHVLHRVTHMRFSRYHTEDELMACAFESQGDGMTLALLHSDAELSMNMPHVAKLLSKALHVGHLHIPMCRYSTSPTAPDVNPDDLKGDDFHQAYNPEGADFAALRVDEDDPNVITAHYYHISKEFKDSREPSKSLEIAELQRVRRWIERMMGLRHDKSGRRFTNVHRRQHYQTHGHAVCHDAVKLGDKVLAIISATNVEHDHTFLEPTLEPIELVAGEPIAGLPPYLHNILVGLCRGVHEIFSPPKEGFHGELVTINITSIIPPGIKMPELRILEGDEAIATAEPEIDPSDIDAGDL